MLLLRQRGAPKRRNSDADPRTDAGSAHGIEQEFSFTEALYAPIVQGRNQLAIGGECAKFADIGEHFLGQCKLPGV
jgi:hypothetical protein